MRVTILTVFPIFVIFSGNWALKIQNSTSINGQKNEPSRKGISGDLEPPKTCGPSDLISKFVDGALLVVSDLHMVTHRSVACEKAAYAATAMRDTFRELPECRKEMVCEVENQLRSSIRRLLMAAVQFVLPREFAVWLSDLILQKESPCEEAACERYDEIYGRHPLALKITQMSGNRRYIRPEVDEALESCGTGEEERSFLHVIWAGFTFIRRFGGILTGCAFKKPL
ncbi:unnamed protein product [Allacma fusca]|uniref:Uncharacterized protein n=1 Tax=Allacma fusca TaxID=39272 RepID=A0A8J2J4Z3_9HEXA|nr:unnamed protein product [Allacma fusca]